MPLISVCIIAENSLDLVLKSCSSVLEQTSQDFEVLIAIGGQSQGTAVLPESMKQDGRVRLVEITGNRIAQLNGLVQASTGSYIQFLEAGDALEPRCLKTFSQALSVAPEIVLIACSYRLTTVDGTVIEEPALDQVDAYDEILGGRKIANRALNYLEPSFERLSTICFRKDFALNGFDDSYFLLSEFEFFLRLLAKGDCIFLSDRLCRVSKFDRQTEKSAVRESMIWLADFIRLRDAYQQTLRSEQVDYEEQDFYSERWSGEDSLIYQHLSRQIISPLVHDLKISDAVAAAKDLDQWSSEHIINSYARLTFEMGKCLRTIDWWKNYTSIEAKKRIEDAYSRGRADATTELLESKNAKLQPPDATQKIGTNTSVKAAIKRVARKVKTRLERKNG